MNQSLFTSLKGLEGSNRDLSNRLDLSLFKSIGLTSGVTEGKGHRNT